MTVYIYCDEGAGPFSVRQSAKRFKERGALVRLLKAKALLEGDWLADCSLFVMPGGRDQPYDRTLSGLGTDLLHHYVERGGNYLGICAGAYFASAKILFSPEEEAFIEEQRDLGFFPGCAKGPALGWEAFSYSSEKGARAALLQKPCGDSFYTYFNGGCTFEFDQEANDVSVLARYQSIPGKPAAVVSMKVGKGKVLLSGVHLEYLSTSLSTKDPYLQPILPQLLSDEDKKHSFWEELLKVF